jgi:hypothetical protein
MNFWRTCVNVLSKLSSLKPELEFFVDELKNMKRVTIILNNSL